MIMSVFTATASQMVTPLISKYAMSLGAPLTLAAAVSSMMSIVAMFLRPVSGLCSDRYNRKKIILTANILTSLCLAGYSITSDVNSLMAIRFLHGVVFPSPSSRAWRSTHHLCRAIELERVLGGWR